MESSYYKKKMAEALEKGSEVEYNIAKENWADAKAKEETEKVGGETSLGASSDYYKDKMADALEKGSKAEYSIAKENWAKEKAKEEAEKVLDD